MPVSISSIFQEEIQKNFHNVLPPECVKILAVMADQMMTMEKAINSNHSVMMKMMQYISLMEPHRKEMEGIIKKFDAQFGNDLAMSEKIKED